MPDLSLLSQFHFIRSLWLLLLIPAVLLQWLLLRRQDVSRTWKKTIAPHLLAHLLVGKDKKGKLRPANLFFPVVFLLIMAMAGPTWQQEPLPFTEDQAPLVIALDLSVEMNAVDIQPSRVERAKQKIRDLMERRSGSRTALLVYAGSAHLILPLTDDQQIMETYLDSLHPEIMPKPGKRADLAIDLAEKMLAKEITPGSILFITNRIESKYFPAFDDWSRENKSKILILGMGRESGGPIPLGNNLFLTDENGNRVTSRLDREGLLTLSRGADVYVTSVTVDDSDVGRINRNIQRHLQNVLSEDENRNWKDFGYFLLFPAALLALFWFRRGWTIRWVSGLIVFLFFMQPVTLKADSSGFINLWMTADQQGRYYFERSDYAKAAQLFENPLWKGISFYFNKDYQNAIQQFSRLDTAESYLNLGNAYARLGQYENALESFQQALKRKPGHVDAQHNFKLIKKIIEDKKSKKDEEEESQPGSLIGADEIKISDPKDKTKRPEIEGDPQEIKMDMLTDEQINEMWMRRVQTSPADFLRFKFSYQLLLDDKKTGQQKKK